MRAIAVFVALLLAGCLNISLFPELKPVEERSLGGEGKAKILLLDLSGLISEEGRGGIPEEPSLVARLKEELTQAAKDPEVKAIVLRINSPGGTVTASDIIYHELLAFKEKSGAKIVSSILDLGASGAFYIAMASDKIVAHPTGVTGSIGVIMLVLNVEGLLQKVGVATEAIKSGPHKDIGSPFRPMTAEEREIFQSVINGMYGRFLSIISERRHLPIDRVKEIADGRIFTAQQAKEAGLIDEIGYLQDAVEIAKKEAGVSEAKLIVYARPTEFRSNIYAGGAGRPDFTETLRRIVSLNSPKFMYLWMP